MRCIPPNSRRVGYIVPIDGALYMGSIYTNNTQGNSVVSVDTLVQLFS